MYIIHFLKDYEGYETEISLFYSLKRCAAHWPAGTLRSINQMLHQQKSDFRGKKTIEYNKKESLSFLRFHFSCLVKKLRKKVHVWWEKNG